MISMKDRKPRVMPQRYSREEAKDIVNDNNQILALLDKLEIAADADAKIREMGLVVERLANGRPISTLSNVLPYMGKMEDPSSPENVLGTTIQKWAAIMTKNKDSVKGVAANPSLENKSAETIVNKLIEYFQIEEKTARKWKTSALYAGQHGTGLMKIYYNPKDQQVHWEPMSIYSVWLQNAERVEEVKWCVIRNYIDPDTATEIIANAYPDWDGEASCEDYDDSLGLTREGTAKYEIWYRPCFKYPTGLYACVIDDKVVEAMEYPYVFNDGINPPKSMLPVVWWSARSNRGATLGTSFAFDLAQLQMKLDTMNSRILKTAIQSSSMLLLPKALSTPDYFDQENLIISYDSIPAEQLNNIRWIPTAPLDPQIIHERDQLKEQMSISAGLSESTLGGGSKDASGTAIAYRAELDQDGWQDAAASQFSAKEIAWELTLQLVKHYYTDAQIPVQGEDPIAFRGVDLAGVSIHLEPQSENESLQSSKIEQTKMDIANGFASPDALAKLQPTAATAGMRRIVEVQIDKFLNGQEISLTSNSAPPELVLDVVDERINKAMIRKDYETQELLELFKDDYIQSVAQETIQQEEATAGAPSPERPPVEPGAAPLPETMEDKFTGV